MKRRSVVFAFLFMFLIVTLSVVSAAENSSSETEKVQDAYTCLDEKVKDNCDTLSTEEKIFSLLSVGRCRSELLSEMINGQCWAATNSFTDCDLKTTSEAILALSGSSVSTKVQAAKSWLKSQTRTPTELDWFIQVETSEASTCTVESSGVSYNFHIEDDKTISGNLGQGLSISDSDYWLEVSPSAYNDEFQISCDKDFTTGLLFKESLSDIVHVFPESSSASAGGTTKEKIDSLCFEDDNICDYEGSLWAAFVLNAEDEDISSYLPYLITLAEDNERFLPDSFLYSITQSADYKVSLLSQQIGNKWWDVSGNKYYDTALALQPFQHETLTEKTNAKNWLLESQGSDGCWDSGNVKNTGLILSSIWSELGPSINSPETGTCEAEGNYCVSSGSCNGEIVSEYSCSGFSSVCCTTPREGLTCEELGGNLCDSNEVCSRGEFVSSSDSYGKSCCVSGTCKIPDSPTGLSECEEKGGICRSGPAKKGEKEANYDCTSAGETCYIISSSGNPPGRSDRSYFWIILLSISIVLVVIGIIFREKLRHLWLRIKSKFGKSGRDKSRGQGQGRPPFGFPPSSQGRYSRPERRIIPRGQLPQRRPQRSQGRPVKSRSSKELDDVLKKLKDMSK